MNRYGRALVKFLITIVAILVMFGVVAGVILGVGWLLVQPFVWLADRFPESAEAIKQYAILGVALVYAGAFFWFFVKPAWEGCLADVDREDRKRAEKAP